MQLNKTRNHDSKLQYCFFKTSPYNPKNVSKKAKTLRSKWWNTKSCSSKAQTQFQEWLYSYARIHVTASGYTLLENPGLCLCVHNTPTHTLSKYILWIQAEEEDGFPLISLCTGDLWPWCTSRSVCRCLRKHCVKIYDRDNNPLHWCMDSWLAAAF